jgi:hypothetical protein
VGVPLRVGVGEGVALGEARGLSVGVGVGVALPWHVTTRMRAFPVSDTKMEAPLGSTARLRAAEPLNMASPAAPSLKPALLFPAITVLPVVPGLNTTTL